MTNRGNQNRASVVLSVQVTNYEMDANRRVTQSTTNASRDTQENEGAYWGRVIDPMTIEQGQAEAIRMARRAASSDPTALLNTTQTDEVDESRSRPQGATTGDNTTADLLMDEEIPFTSNLTNYTEHSLQPAQAMQTTFVSNSPSTQGEMVTTPRNMEMSLLDGPLDPVFTRPTHQGSSEPDQQGDLDTQPMRGPKEPANTTADLLDNFIDENYGDVLRTSILNPSSYLSLLLVSVKTSPQQPQPQIMAMDWYVPDGTNRRIIEVPEKTIADFRSPGGGTGALILTLSRMILHYNTARYLVDINMGELFGWITNQWRRTGLYCSTQPFVIKDLITMTNHCSAALQMDLEQEQQTSVIQLSNRWNAVSLPPLPVMPDPEAYILQQDAMTPNMRRNYTRDQTNVALTYIKEYENAQQWQQDPQYDKQQVLQRLQII